ncbi:Rho GTPase activating protein [Meyerozyma guilliermondii]
MSIDDRSIVSNPQSPPMHEPLRTPSGLLSHESLTAKLSRQPTTPGSSFQVMPSTVQEDEETTLLVKPDNFNTIDIVVASTINVHHQEVSLQRKSDDPNVSISICDKASGKEMWRIRKSYSQLVAFDNEIRPIVEYFGLPPLPEKTLFFSSSPPKVDTRRLQLQDFFNTLFLIPHIPRMLLFRICKYLSADLVNPLDDFKSGASKEGFLIRRYKGLGSTWKVRWCQVDGPYLEIYEAPGGTFLEQLPLWHTQIGRQSSDSVAEDKGYRHAFLILEQEKFKMSSTSKHFFCAESDTERDSWISALIQYTGWSDSATPAESTDSLVRGSERFGSNERVENLDEKEREKETKKSRKRSLFPFRKNADDDQSSQNQNQNSQPNSNSQFSSSQFSNSHQNSNSNSNSQPYQSAQLQPHFLSQPLSQASSELPSYIGNMKLDDSPAKTIFGRDVLEAYNLSHHEFQGRSIPSVCFRCLDYLVKTGAVYEEGIFRLSGSASQIRGLREQFNTKFDIDLCANPSPDIHTVAGLFKTYLRELPHPILGAQPYSDLQHIVMSRGDTGSKSSLAYIFRDYLSSEGNISKVNYDLCYVIFGFLKYVIENSSRNKMSLRNVCIVFVPTLNISLDILSTLLVDYDCIFAGGDPVPDHAREVLDIHIPNF